MSSGPGDERQWNRKLRTHPREAGDGRRWGCTGAGAPGSVHAPLSQATVTPTGSKYQFKNKIIENLKTANKRALDPTRDLFEDEVLRNCSRHMKLTLFTWSISSKQNKTRCLDCWRETNLGLTLRRQNSGKFILEVWVKKIQCDIIASILRIFH